MKDPIKDFINTKKKMEEKYPGYTFEVGTNDPVLTRKAFERTKPCREGHNCCHNNNFGGELCEDCSIDPDTDYV